MGTALEIGMGAEIDLIYKRMPRFPTERERTFAMHLHRECVQVLQVRVGLQVAPGDTIRLADEEKGKAVVYIVQEKQRPSLRLVASAAGSPGGPVRVRGTAGQSVRGAAVLRR